MKLKRNLISKLILVILVLVSVVCLTYPKIAEVWNKSRVTEVIQQYDETVDQMDEEIIQSELLKAQVYNKDILNGIEDSNYSEILNTDDSDLGLIGYLSIPSIDLKLPIYHSTKNDAITKGVGHMSNTSLPIGGNGTHSVLSSHCGMPNHIGFTNLDKVKEGDVFTITVLNQTITYKVDQIKTVDPYDNSDIQTEDDKDYVTLLTCYPYGINSHRLLVRGHRIANAVDEEMTVTRTWMDMINDLSFQTKALGITGLIIILIVSKIRKK